MSGFFSSNELQEKEIVPGFFARMVHTDQLTLSKVRVTQGSILPEHSHPHQQITHLLKGTFKLVIGTEVRICEAGDIAVIPGNSPHSGEALTDCELIDIFHPVRVDYKEMG